MNYYNEWEPYAAQWLRNLIREGLIPNGFVDTRSIKEVEPGDLLGYTQCHFFAGIGGWSLALQLAGIPSDTEVWTGSVPCQPYSSAGKQKGTADERHLWPAFYNLIKVCRPQKIYGEQVEAAIQHGWLDLVFSDLEESEGYSCGAVVLPASSVGSFHKRNRLYWVGHRDHIGQLQAEVGNEPQRRTGELALGEPSSAGGLEHAEVAGVRGVLGIVPSEAGSESAEDVRPESRRAGEGSMGHTDDCGQGIGGRIEHEGQAGQSRKTFWDDAEWIGCRDGYYRPVESISSEMVDGFPDGMGLVRDGDHAYIAPLIEETENLSQRLKGYGNSLVPQVAAIFVRSTM